MPLEEGKKLDTGKAPMSLIPFASTREIAKVLAFGAEKYDAWNWAKGMDWSRLISAAERHLGSFKDGIDRDEETGLMHLAHAGACILFLISYQLFNLGRDDRFKGFIRLPEEDQISQP